MTTISWRHLAVWSLALGCISSSVRAAKPEAVDAQQAQVQQVLRTEATSRPDALNRRTALKPSLRPETKSDPTWWQAGYLKVDDNWRPYEQSALSSTDAATLAEYHQQRIAAPKTADGQFALANWCRLQKLIPQERAHLVQTLLLADADRDTAAIYKRLGLSQVGSSWLSPVELAAFERHARQVEEDLKEWRPQVQRIARNLRGNAKQRKLAEEELAKIESDAAIPALIETLAPLNEDAAVKLVDVLSRRSSFEASQALAGQAVFSVWPKVRDRSCEHLSSRQMEDYVPELLSCLAAPIKTASRETSDGAYSQFVALQEGYDQIRVARFTLVHEVLIDQTRVLVPHLSGLYRPTRNGGLQRIGDTTAAARAQVFAKLGREYEHDLLGRAVEDINETTEKMNRSVATVLSRVSGEPEQTDSHFWWQWWADQAGVESSGEKSVVIVVDEKQEGAPRVRKVVNPSCLVAGTPVWTERGFLGVEKIVAGDRVLAKDIETGELAYKPVLHTTIRKPVPVKKFVVAGQPVVASSGHNFWVSGDGWTKTRELIPQQPIHTAIGMARVESVEDEAKPAPVYNLVVADFHTYFVGPAMLLSHDVLPPRPTNVKVPGLAAK